ncbi:MAG TPA: FMN-binding negative transcriptional regulator [Rhodanobacteraceae bacterium]|jgi:transcriptional regulator|nr:FMN-binding negative transcriptional regulator [Rhodanobacteraceae bacterium]
MTYPHPWFREDRVEVLHDAIGAISFGTLLTHVQGEFVVTHLPLEADAEAGPKGTLRGHVGRYNPQWRDIGDGIPALAIFQGPHAYVSPSWYPGKREDPRQVPTWDYVTVHAHGTLRTVNDPDRLYAHLARLVKRNEHGRAEPWKITDAPADYLREQMCHIVGLELRIEKLEGRYKLSQNRDAADQEGARAGLASGNERERAVAAAISFATRLGESA